MYRRSLLRGLSDISGIASSRRYQWIDLRDDRLSGDELCSCPAFSHQKESRTVAPTYLSDRNHWTRFFGRIATGTVGAPIRESE